MLVLVEMTSFVVMGYEAMKGDLVFGFWLKAKGFLLEMASFVCYEAMIFKEGDLVCFVVMGYEAWKAR